MGAKVPEVLRESGVVRTHRRCGHGCCLWPWPPSRATVGGGAATASPSEGPKERHTALQPSTSCTSHPDGGMRPVRCGRHAVASGELCQRRRGLVAGRCWPSPSAVIELSRRNDPDDRRPAPNRSRSRASSPPVSTGWCGRRSIPAWWPGSVARVNLAKATDLLDERYGLGEALGGMILSTGGRPRPLRHHGRLGIASPLLAVACGGG